MPLLETFTRRKVLQGISGWSFTLVAGSWPTAGCSRNANLPPFKLHFFSAEGYQAVLQIADVLLPGGVGAVAASKYEVARKADRVLGTLNTTIQTQLRWLLLLFDRVPFLARSLTPFYYLSGQAAINYLRYWQHGNLGFMLQGFNGLRRLAVGIYYADERSWAAIGYDGPWIGAKDLGYGIDNQAVGELVNKNVYSKFPR